MFKSKKLCLLIIAVLFLSSGCLFKKNSLSADEAFVDQRLLQSGPVSAPPQVDPGLPQESFEQDVQGAQNT